MMRQRLSRSIFNPRFLSTAPPRRTDVAIVGGGVVGAHLATELASTGLDVTLIEAGTGPAISMEGLPHPRSYALSPASLQRLRLFSNSRLGYYQRMQIWEAGQPAVLSFAADDINEPHLGAVVEDAVILEHLWKQLDCHVATQTSLTALHLPSGQGPAVLELDSPKHGRSTLQAMLVVGADGANSSVRRLASIATTRHDYQQAALTLTVELASPHGGQTFQRFLPTGPLALLPTFHDHHAIVVWSTTPAIVHAFKDSPDLVHHVNQLLQQGPQLLPPVFSHSTWPSPIHNLLYGVEKLLETAGTGPAMANLERTGYTAPPLLQSTASRPFSFALQRQTVERYTAPRLALVGDAAHTVHPLAGQGLNLGLDDVADLVRCIHKASSSGMDPATFLSEYEPSRALAVQLTAGGIHALHSVFADQAALSKHVKAAGMNLMAGVPALRRQLAQVACWGVGSVVG